MARLFLIRHGQPEGAWGSRGGDPGLSPLGREQALAAASALKAYGPLAVVSSPMLRCQETAAPFAAWRGVAPLIEPRVSEVVAPDDVEDRAGWLQARFPWRDRSRSMTWAALEPALHAWRARMLAYVRSVREDTAVFTHFIGINVMCGAALGAENTIVCVPNHASITELEVGDNEVKLVRFGDEMVVDDVR